MHRDKMDESIIGAVPGDWEEGKVREQAENVKPYKISLAKEENSVLTLCLEDTPPGKVLFCVALDEADYVRHRKAWHSVHLPDDRRFGLALVEDAEFKPFCEALSAALDDKVDAETVADDDEDIIDGPGEGGTVRAQAVQDPDQARDWRLKAQARHDPEQARRLKLNLDVGRGATGRVTSSSTTSLSSPPSIMSLPSGSVYEMGPPQLRGGVGELIRRFQAAVSSGNSQEAQQVAKQLTQYRANLDLHVNLNSPTEKEIAVRIHVEDQHSSGGCIVLNLKPSTKISQLKTKILLKYGFAPETQKWIIGKKMAHDDDTLAKLGVHINNTPVFLYLLAHKTIGMTKEDLERRYGHLRGPGHRSPPPAPPITAAATRQRPWAPTTPPSAGATGGAQTAPIKFQHAIADVAPIQPPTQPPVQPAQRLADRTPDQPLPSPEGWPCEKCTFLNFWTRSACNMCSADRPEDLTPPPNFVIPREERERLQLAEEEERKAREMQPQRAETDPTLLTLRQRDLDLMLRLITDARADEHMRRQQEQQQGGCEADHHAQGAEHGGGGGGGGHHAQGVDRGGGGGGGGHHDPYSDDMDPGDDVPDSLPVCTNKPRRKRSGSLNSDLAIDGPEDDSPDGVDANIHIGSLTNSDNSNELPSTEYPNNRLMDGHS